MERIELHPIFNRYTVHNDYYEGELMNPGDALGRDCMIAAFLPEKQILCGYIKMMEQKMKIGFHGMLKSMRQLTEKDSEMVVLLAHIQNPIVSVGEEVKEGHLLAYVGNNGFCRNPHIHIGAYWDGKPLMIGFDANKVGRVREKNDQCYWMMGISNNN